MGCISRRELLPQNISMCFIMICDSVITDFMIIDIIFGCDFPLTSRWSLASNTWHHLKDINDLTIKNIFLESEQSPLN